MPLERVTHNPSIRRETALEQAGWGWLQQDLPHGKSHCVPFPSSWAGRVNAGASSSKVNPKQENPYGWWREHPLSEGRPLRGVIRRIIGLKPLLVQRKAVTAAGSDPAAHQGRSQQCQMEQNPTHRDLTGPVQSLHPVLQVLLVAGLEEVALG